MLFLVACLPSAGVGSVRQMAITLTGGEFCTPSAIMVRRTLEHPALTVSSRPDHCSTWPGVLEGVEAISGQMLLSGHRVPIVFYANDAALQRPDEVRRIIVRVVGGPGIPVGPSGPEAAYLGRSTIPTIMVSVGYMGTSHNSLYPNENYSSAVSQVAQLADALCSLHTDSNILLIAESFGAAIAPEAFRQQTRCGNRIGLFFVVPLVEPVDSAVQHTINNNDGGADRARMIRVLSDSRDSTYEVISVFGRDILMLFMPPPERNMDLEARIVGIRPAAMRFVFGSADTITNPNAAVAFAARHGDRALVIEGMGHYPSAQHLPQIASAVDASFRDLALTMTGVNRSN
jgi:pimeloyl-ACP methyl ester carboxylesterase